MLASEMMRDIRNTSRKVPSISRNTLQSSVSISAAAVTTPLPPLKPKYRGYECPKMQKVPARYLPMLTTSSE